MKRLLFFGLLLLLIPCVLGALGDGNQTYFTADNTVQDVLLRVVNNTLPAFNSSGQINQAFKFTSGGTVAEYQDNDVLEILTNNFTVNFWGWLDNGANGDFYVIAARSGEGWDVYKDTSIGGALILYVFDSNGSKDSWGGCTLPTNQTWHMWTWTMNRSVSGSTVIPYIDSVACTPIAGGTGIPAPSTVDGSAVLKQFGGKTGVSPDWIGMMDEIGTWTRALSPAEITTLYNAGAGLAYPFGGGGGGAPASPTWVSPTPADGTVNNTQVLLNASCAAGLSYYMNFSASNPPMAPVLINNGTGEWLTNVSTSQTYYYTAACYNATSTTYSDWTAVRSWTYDIINPAIVLLAQNEFNTANMSVLNQYDDWLNLSVNFTDNNDLYGMEVNITRDGVTVYNLTNLTLSGTSYIFTRKINVTGWTAGRYTVYLAVADSHTARSIPDYQMSAKKSSLTFKTPNKNNIKIETRSLSNISAQKEGDRYSFTMAFDDGLTTNRTFDVKTDACQLKYHPASGYKAHFISACSVRGGGNWIDFEGVAGVPTVTRLDDYHYTVRFESVPPVVTFRSIGGLNEVNKSYSWYRGTYAETVPYAVKGDPFTLMLNVTQDDTVSLAASLLFNETARTVLNTTGLNWTAFYSIITMNDNLTFSYNWTVNVTQDDLNVSQFNVSGSIAVNEWLIDACTSFSNRRIRWDSYAEDVPAQAQTQTFQLYLTYYPTTSSNNKTFNWTYSAATYFEICASPANLTLYMDIYAQATEATTGYVHRFFVQNGTFNGSTWTNYSIYNFNTTTGIGTLKLTTRRNDNYDYMLNVLAYLQRFYVGEGVWRTVQMDRSGDYGLLHFNIKEAGTDYRLIYLDSQNNVLDQTQSMKFICSAGVCDLTQLLSDYSAASAASNLSASQAYDNATGVLTVTWTSPVTETHTVDIAVQKQTMTGEVVICSTSQTGSGGSFPCNLSAYIGSFFVAVDGEGESLLAEWVAKPAPRLADYMDPAEQSLWSFGILVTVVMAGLFSPVGATISMVLGLIFLFFMGILSPLTITLIMVGGAVAAYIGVKVRA